MHEQKQRRKERMNKSGSDESIMYKKRLTVKFLLGVKDAEYFCVYVCLYSIKLK